MAAKNSMFENVSVFDKHKSDQQKFSPTVLSVPYLPV